MLQIIKNIYYKYRDSIAFYPSIIILIFFILSILVLLLEFSEVGKYIKESYPVLIIGDAATARTILGTLIGGIISITVFSFSMVMVVMNQTASHFSQKLRNSFVEAKLPQLVLGFNVGTITFSLVVLFRVYENDGVLDIPSLGILLAIIFGITNIFFFVYFINYISKSIELYNIVQQIHDKTLSQLGKVEETDTAIYKETQKMQALIDEHKWYTYESDQSGFFQDVHETDLVKLAKKEGILIKIDAVFGKYIVKGTPLFSATKKMDPESSEIEKIYSAMVFYVGEKIDENLFYGFRQISEIAVKALSPGINDPATAIFCIEHLKDLYAQIMNNPRNNVFLDDEAEARLITQPVNFNELLYIVIGPLRFYGKADAVVMTYLLELIKSLAYLDRDEKHHSRTLSKHLTAILLDVDKAIQNREDRNVIQEKVFELLSIPSYFHLNPTEIGDFLTTA